MGEKVSITEAARLLGVKGDKVERSTLSRYITQHADALNIEKNGKESLIDFEVLLAHRQENIRLHQRKKKDVDDAPIVSKQLAHRGSTQADIVARKVLAEAEMKELQLAKEKKLLTSIFEVQEMARDAINSMISSIEGAINDRAEDMAASMGGEARLYRPHLKAICHKGLNEFRRKMLIIAGDEPDMVH